MDNARPEGAFGLKELVGSLVTDLQDLVRGEFKLARAEMSQKVDVLTASAISLIGGALVAFAGLIVLLEGIAIGLALYMPAWAAYVIVGVVVAIIGAVMARAGLAKLSLSTLSPDRTASSLAKDARVVKERT